MITNATATEIAPLPSSHASLQCPVCADPHPKVWMRAPDRFNGRQYWYELLRCSACSLVWLKDPPSKFEMGEHYGAKYDRTIAHASQASDHWLPRRNALARLKSGGAILDLGCGSGGFLSTLKDSQWKLFGVEMSEGAAQVARERCGAEVFVGDVPDAPFAANSFDAITCFNVFEHMYEPREVLAKVAEWLKPGGVFYTMMPNIDSAGPRIFRSYWYGLELPRHLFHFSPATFRMVAQSVGLREVSIGTHRNLYFERSVGYIADDTFRKLGFVNRPLAHSGEAGIAWKVLRKIFRMTVLPIFTAAASFAGDGETITAVLTK